MMIQFIQKNYFFLAGPELPGFKRPIILPIMSLIGFGLNGLRVDVRGRLVREDFEVVVLEKVKSVVGASVV